MDTVKVLVWGTAEQGPCAYFRGHLYDEALAALGVEMRHISSVRFKPAKGWEDKAPEEALAAGKMEVDTSDLEWADVLMYRRYYNTSWACLSPRRETSQRACSARRMRAKQRPTPTAQSDRTTSPASCGPRSATSG